jgi:hypothetical protein|eukprot:g7757.t1
MESRENEGDGEVMLPDSVLSHYESLPPPKRILCMWFGIHASVFLFCICGFVMATETDARPTIAYESVTIIVNSIGLFLYGWWVLNKRRFEMDLGILTGSSTMMSLIMLTVALLSSSHIVVKGQSRVTAAEAAVTAFAAISMVGYFTFGVILAFKRHWVTRPYAPESADVALDHTLSEEKLDFILHGVEQLLTEVGMTEKEVDDVKEKVGTIEVPRWTHADVESMMQGPEEFARLLNIVTGGKFNVHSNEGQEMIEIFEESTMFREYEEKFHNSNWI